MSTPPIDLDSLLKLRLVVARFGEKELAAQEAFVEQLRAFLEDVFWVEGSDGKWIARKAPTRSVDELVREQTSPAVKAALKILLEAPSAAGAAKKTKKGKANA